MKISIRTKNGAELSAFERKIIKMATNFYAEKLMTNRLANTLTVNINIIQDYHKKTGYIGDVMPLDEFDNYRPKEFEINLDRPKRFKSMLNTLAHESVHLKQFAKGELKTHKGTNKTIFHKVSYDDDDNYWDCPWEIEAYGREPGLWQKFKPIYRALLRENRE